VSSFIDPLQSIQLPLFGYHLTLGDHHCKLMHQLAILPKAMFINDGHIETKKTLFLLDVNIGLKKAE